MRPLAILLLLANLTLFGYLWLDRGGGGEAVRLADQVQPDKIKLLSPQQVAALGPAKVAALADVCVEWGPFGEAERARALAELEPLALGKLLTQRRVDTNTGWWVYLPPFSNKAAADRRAAELRAAGVRDLFVVDGGPQRFAISLGVFRTEEAATAFAAALATRNVNGAKVGARQQVIVQTMLVIRDPQAPVVQKLKDLQSGYPGAELRIGACDKG